MSISFICIGIAISYLVTLGFFVRFTGKWFGPMFHDPKYTEYRLLKNSTWQFGTVLCGYKARGVTTLCPGCLNRERARVAASVWFISVPCYYIFHALKFIIMKGVGVPLKRTIIFIQYLSTLGEPPLLLPEDTET